MKKIFNMMMATAIAAFTFTACEDVPEPYNNPYDGYNSNKEPEVVIEPAGSGTLADPYNVARALEVCAEVGETGTEAEVYAKGVITSISEISTSFGNATFMISDDGNNALTVYRSKGLDNAPIEDENLIAKGDTVVICGKLVNYKGNTPEFTQGCYIVSIIKGEGGSEPVANPGTEEAPLTVAEALAYIDGLAADEQSPTGYVKGKIVAISEIDTGNYGNATYTISDDGTDSNTLQIYRGYGLNGEKFTSADAIKVGDEVVVSGKLVNYKGNTKQFAQGSKIISINGQGGGETSNTVGTKDAPKSIADALAAINAMADGATSTEFWYVKGKVVKVTTNQANFEKYGNLNYLISEDGTENNTLTIYSGDGLNGEKFTGIDALAAGDEVVVYGQLQKYVNANTGNMTPEMAKGNYLVSLTKGGGETPTPEPATGTGTFENPLTASQAYDIVAAMEAGVISEADYYVKGKVTSIKYTFSAQYGTATFNFSDDGNASDKEFIAYSCYYLGNQSWTENDTQIAVGDEVIVCGKVVNYNGNIPEFASKNNYLVSLNGKTAGGNDTPDNPGTESGEGIEIAMADFGLENAAAATTLTASDGTVLTFAQEGGNNAPKYYTAAGGSVRMYALNSLTITAKKAITSVVITTTDPYNGTAYNGNDAMYGEAGGSKVTTTKVSDTQVSFTGFSNNTLKIVNDYETNSGGTQLRVMKVTVTYAK